MAVREIAQRADGGQPPVKVRNDDGADCGTEGLLEHRRIERPRLPVDVDQHGSRTGRLDGTKISGEVVRGEDDFVARGDGGCPQRKFYGKRAGTTERDVRRDVVDLMQLGEPGPERFGVRSVIATPVARFVGAEECLADGSVGGWPGGSEHRNCQFTPRGAVWG